MTFKHRRGVGFIRGNTISGGTINVHEGATSLHGYIHLRMFNILQSEVAFLL